MCPCRSSSHLIFEHLFEKTPAFTELLVFGSLCFAHYRQAKGDKFASTSWKCVFFCYPFGKKGWRLFGLEKKEIFVSRECEVL